MRAAQPRRDGRFRLEREAKVVKAQVRRRDGATFHDGDTSWLHTPIIHRIQYADHAVE